MPTFRNICLFHLHRRVGMKYNWGWECSANWKDWLRLFFEPNLFPYKCPNILNPRYTLYLWRWNRQSVPKCWHLNYRSRWRTQKKAYDIWNTFSTEFWYRIQWYHHIKIAFSSCNVEDWINERLSVGVKAINGVRQIFRIKFVGKTNNFESKIAVRFLLFLANKIIANLLFSGMTVVDEGSTIIETLACLHQTIQYHTKQDSNLQFQRHEILQSNEICLCLHICTPTL
jgi:hypothetical protein